MSLPGRLLVISAVAAAFGAHFHAFFSIGLIFLLLRGAPLLSRTHQSGAL
jgi:hypothetical protein